MNRFLNLDPGPQGGFECDDEDQGDRGFPTCNRCGATDLEWVDIGGAKPRWRLYDGKKLHVCNPISASDFPDLTK